MKAMVGLVIAILVLFIINLFWPADMIGVNEAQVTQKGAEQTTTTNEVIDLPVELNQPNDDEKVKLMTAAYEVLEDGRKKLKRRLSRLKHEMWGLKFEADQAKKMSNIMLEAHKLIRNPEMRGAFLSVKGIEDETAKIKFADKSLDEIVLMIEQNKNTSKLEN